MWVLLWTSLRAALGTPHWTCSVSARCPHKRERFKAPPGHSPLTACTLMSITGPVQRFQSGHVSCLAWLPKEEQTQSYTDSLLQNPQCRLWASVGTFLKGHMTAGPCLHSPSTPNSLWFWASSIHCSLLRSRSQASYGGGGGAGSQEEIENNDILKVEGKSVNQRCLGTTCCDCWPLWWFLRKSTWLHFHSLSFICWQNSWGCLCFSTLLGVFAFHWVVCWMIFLLIPTPSCTWISFKVFQ